MAGDTFHASGFFYIPRMYQKTRDFLMFPGGIEKNQWHKMG